MRDFYHFLYCNLFIQLQYLFSKRYILQTFMNNNDSMDKSPQQDQSLDEGANKKFLNFNHAQYEEGDSHDQNQTNQNQDQSNDESMDKYLAQMENKQDESDYVPIQSATYSRGNRGNRGNRGDKNQQEQQKNEVKEEQVQEPQEEKPSLRKGRGNRMPNNLSDDQKQPQSSPSKIKVQKSQSEEDKPEQKENQDQEKQQEKPQKNDVKQKSDSESEGWDASMDKKQTQNEQKPQPRNGRSGRGLTQVKQQENNKVLDESNWQQQADNQNKKQQENHPKRGGRKNDDDEQELKPDNDKSDQHSKQPTEQNQRRGRGNRGNRQTRDQNGQNENENNPNEGRGNRRGNRDFNNGGNDGYQNRPQYNRGQGNYGRNRQNNNGRQNENWRGGNSGGFHGGFRGNQDRENRGQHQQRNGRNFNRTNFNNDRQDNRQQQSNHSNNQSSNHVPVYDAVSIIEPKGAQSWPEVSFYVRKCKVSVTLKTINENKADAVVFPFEDMNFKLYPSTLISQNSKFNYRKKLQEKQEQDYFKDRNCYPKKGQPLGNFNDVLFWKVSSRDEAEFKKFFLQLFRFLDLQKKSKSVVFPICKELGGFDVLLTAVIECLHSLSNHNQGFIEKIQFTTKDPEYFKIAGKTFWEMIANHIDSNKIYIL